MKKRDAPIDEAAAPAPPALGDVVIVTLRAGAVAIEGPALVTTCNDATTTIGVFFVPPTPNGPHGLAEVPYDAKGARDGYSWRPRR